MSFVNFQELKAKVPISAVLREMLGLALKESGDQLRGHCPICKDGGDRAFVATVSKGAFYCFKHAQGGDIISLVAAVRDCPPKDAAAMIARHFGLLGDARPEEPHPQQPAEAAGLKPLPYLAPEHPSLASLGLSPETCKHFGAGFAPKGIMRGRLAVPIHDEAGVLLAYVGIAVSPEQQPRLLYPKDFAPKSVIFNAHRVSDGQGITAVCDPLSVLLAWQNGIEAVVAVLGETITVTQLKLLAAFLERRKLHIENWA